MRPDFVIIGAMKCATSTLHDQLDRVAGVSMSDPKEPNFFSDEVQWGRGIGWYESLFSTMPGGDIKGESSTHYTKLPTYPHCVERIVEHLPDAKLIYVMRDPVDRIVSQYVHEWSQHVIEDGCMIDEAIHRYPILLDYSRYAMQIKPYVAAFGHRRVLPVFFERLMRDPQSEFERVGSFLGIHSEMSWDSGEAKNISSQRQRRSPMLDSILRNPLLKALRRRLIPESMRAKVRSRWTMEHRPVLSELSLEWIAGQLDTDMQQLGSMLDRTLTCASYKESILAGKSPEWVDAGGV